MYCSWRERDEEEEEEDEADILQESLMRKVPSGWSFKTSFASSLPRHAKNNMNKKNNNDKKKYK